jgi:glutamate-1-semialdehyde 2,1-aminomutase
VADGEAVVSPVEDRRLPQAKVVLTRSTADNAPLRTRLEARGVSVVELPTAAVRLIAGEPDARTIHGWLERAAAIAFTSRHGVEGFAATCGSGCLLRFQERGGLVGAVGLATASAVSALGGAADVVAVAPATAATLAELLATRLANRAGSLVVAIKGRSARPELSDGLLAAGIAVQSAVVYENAEPAPPTPELAARCAAADAVFVAAPSATDRVLQWVPELRHKAIVAIGPTTAAALAQHHLAAAAIADAPTTEAACSAIGRALRILGRKAWRATDPMPTPLSKPPQELAMPVDSPASARTWTRAGSDALVARAEARIPGGVNSPVRACKSVGGKPLHIARGEGPYLWDVDGQRYVDWCMSWGPLILGHAHPDVVAAVRNAAPNGLSYGACHPGEVELAELIVSAFPGAEMCRLVSSGTEAVMTALRLCRGATGRPLVVKFEGGYHGHSDGLLVKAGSGLVTGADPGAEASSKGIPPEVAALTVSLPFADRAAVEALFSHHGERIAAVVVEPLPANNGLLVQTDAFLHGLRALCDQHGALLVLDEVISGFRLQFGGYGSLHGVRADLTTLGKIVGGGMPIGAVVGPAKYLEQLAPVGPVYQAGTLSGNPVSVAAGLATLRLLRDRPAIYAHLDLVGAHLEHALQARGLSCVRVGSIVWPYFAAAEFPHRADAIDTTAVQRFNQAYQHVLEHGHYLPPSAYEVMFPSLAHETAHADSLADAWAEVLRP